MAPEISDGNLLRNCVLFGRLLRGLGIQITPVQVVDLASSLHFVDIGRREDFKNTARAVLVSRQEHLALFDQAFDLFWQARSDEHLLDLDFGTFVRRRQQPKPLQVRQEKPSSSGEDGRSAEEEPQIDHIFTYSDQELLRQKDFATLDDEELAKVKRMMQSLAWNLPPRRTRRTVRARHGAHVDLRRTMRQNLRHGGEVFHLARRKRKEKRRPVVLICDISGSMERYARVLLQFIYVVTSRLDRVESFVFSTRLTRITRQLRSRNVDRALDGAAAAVHDWAGGTRIGEAIRTFNYDWGRRVLGQGAVVLIISDGWDRGDIDLLGREMDRLHRSCHRLIWLNPLLGVADYEPLVRGIQAALPHVDEFLPVHNLASLEQLAEKLAGS
jgi:uncharacterized protein with von Willebrand factor type A (vWA) domain